MSCPKCQIKHSQVKDGCTNAGSQRFRCKVCGCRYTPEPIERGYDEEVRLQALGLHQEGVSLREIGRILEVNHQTVANWINGYANHIPEELPPSILDLAVLDGMYVPPYIRKKRKK
ncbi:MAG: IS1 family transposase [Anaerolineales bacterium]|nr:IS1 family transposase [Anaerolineales bacterium]